MLDAVQQRVLGVLIEKELAVPDSYPLTEATLLSGCNQKSNRDPEMALSTHDINVALVALREAGYATRTDASARAARYRHEVEKKLGLTRAEKAVLCELLVRGPQAPGALKPRVQRMGYEAEPDQIRATLAGMAARPNGALVAEQPHRPRERDQRWGHLLGPRAASHDPEGEDVDAAPPARTSAPPVAAPPVAVPHAMRGAPVAAPHSGRGEPVAAPHSGHSEPVAAPWRPAPAVDQGLVDRVARLERQVLALNEEVYRLRKLCGE